MEYRLKGNSLPNVMMPEATKMKTNPPAGRQAGRLLAVKHVATNPHKHIKNFRNITRQTDPSHTGV